MRFGDTLFFEHGKDGGPNSKVNGYWIIRIKGLFSIAILRFDRGSREAYHSHAFNSISWLLSGRLLEYTIGGLRTFYNPSFKPIITTRDTFHKVYGIEDENFILTFRGPWADTWKELDENGDFITLTHNRVVVN